jgi:hypothetical protein
MCMCHAYICIYTHVVHLWQQTTNVKLQIRLISQRFSVKQTKHSGDTCHLCGDSVIEWPPTCVVYRDWNMSYLCVAWFVFKSFVFAWFVFELFVFAWFVFELFVFVWFVFKFFVFAWFVFKSLVFVWFVFICFVCAWFVFEKFVFTWFVLILVLCVCFASMWFVCISYCSYLYDSYFILCY